MLKRAMTQRHASWSSKDWRSKSNWQRSAVEDAGQSSKDQWKSSTPRAKWIDISHNVEELGTLVKEKRNTGAKSCKESSKCETEIYIVSERMADDDKVEDCDKGRLRKTLKQLRKERDEENFWKKCSTMWARHTREPLKRSGDCARSSRNSYTRGTEKSEDQTTSAPKSGR